MDRTNHQSGGSSSSSSFTDNLFGPKDVFGPSSTSSSGLFSSVFGPSSTGLARDPSHISHSKNTGLPKRQEFGGQKGRNLGVKEGNHVYQNETGEPSYLSSSIYYGGQEVYAPNTQAIHPAHVKKDGGDNDPNGSSASRGNWWQGSLYY